jgi:MoaA/NifB/PqqE/SkfB family radical SAM enzyme
MWTHPQVEAKPHVIPIVSFEGYELETDIRRGAGVYEKRLANDRRFQQAGVYYGVSITTTRGNF